ncbi:hypothetical protein [Alteromonas sp. ASW11-130]|uniref:hypothetical protein n=1 Tax=Alteromonas sp. ASW11-130 TaxID=3015775 RepID=UPI002242C298|nr:hypothetical protein [Alteromonas sp. ASW11-130]MCW8092943.1 hypothetical protein [Alteromonas sp. ASW11-130]
MKKLNVVLLILIMGAQLLGLVKSVHARHGVDEASHQLFHVVGQPHSHADYNAEKFEISYSDEAFEHSNSYQDGNTVFVFDLALINLPAPLPGSVVSTRDSAWDPPYLYDIPPPPKV